MAMYEVPAGTRRLPVERLPIDVPSATLTPELDVVVDGETVGAVDDADAVCYIHADVDGTSAWGVGIAGSTTRASLEAIVSAVNRSTAAN